MLRSFNFLCWGFEVISAFYDECPQIWKRHGHCFFLLNRGKSLTLAGKRPDKCCSFKVVSVTVAVKLGSHVNN